MASYFKLIFKFGAVTASFIALYELSDVLLVYRYFKYEYYISAIAVVALATGIFLSRKFYLTKNELSPDNLILSLTNREMKVLAMISEGKSNKEIALISFVEVSTVKTHVNNIYTKLNLKNRKQAVEAYRKYLTNQKSTFSPPAVI